MTKLSPTIERRALASGRSISLTRHVPAHVARCATATVAALRRARASIARSGALAGAARWEALAGAARRGGLARAASWAAFAGAARWEALAGAACRGGLAGAACRGGLAGAARWAAFARAARWGSLAGAARRRGSAGTAALCRAAAVAAAIGLLGAAAARGEVELIGVEGELAENVLAHLRLDDEPCDAAERRIQQLYRAAPEQIRSALQGLGYYAARISSELEPGEACWRARLVIEPGEPVRIRELDLRIAGEAERDPRFQAVVAMPALVVGEPLDHGSYERLKNRLLDLATERGYADARFAASRIDVYPDERAADVTLHFESGARYEFGAIEIQQDVLREQLVLDFFDFGPGDPYDSRQLATLYLALVDSGYFDTVDVRPLPADRDTTRIPVAVALTPAPSRLITYGVGFSTDTGPRLRFGRNNRRWNDRGHQFGVNAQISPVISEVTANYRFPFGDPRYQWVSFDAGVKRENTETAESESLELGARRVFERPGNWTRTQFLTWRVEDFEVADQIGRSRLLMPGIEWLRVRADSDIRPRQGSRLELELRGGSDPLGSDTTFFQAIADGKWIWSLPSAARFIVRSRVGATAEDSFVDLPPSVRFFAGGDDSVRGYKFESLGPEDETGKVIGGSALLTASFEYEHPLVSRWSLAFFVDSGNAFTGSDFEPKTGTGLGGRWQSPLGPIRVDLAFPLDDADDDVRLHISLGPDL